MFDDILVNQISFMGIPNLIKMSSDMHF